MFLCHPAIRSIKRNGEMEGKGGEEEEGETCDEYMKLWLLHFQADPVPENFHVSCHSIDRNDID